MALITDPDDLNQGTEITFDTSAKTIALAVAGNLSNDGVTLQAVYSFCKEEWLTDANLQKFRFPFEALTRESFELQNGWNWANDTTRHLIRTGGWKVVNTSGQTTEIWSGVVGLGTIEGNDDQLYFDGGAGATDFQLTGQVNQAIQVYRDDNGDGTPDFDRRTSLTIYSREQGQTFGISSIADIGVTTLEEIVYRFPISSAADGNISASDSAITTTTPYTGMSINYYATAQSTAIGGSNYDFGVIIDANGGTKEQVYEFVQYQLRQSADIDAQSGAAVTGKTASPLLSFVGDRLDTITTTNPKGGGTGVYINNLSSVDANSVRFVDNTGAYRTNPFVAAVTLQFGANLVADSSAIYRVYFTDAGGSTFGSAAAILVDNNAGSDVAGAVGGNSTITFDFDYDGNVQGGRSAGTDAAITVVASGLGTAKYVSATGTITRATTNVVALNAAFERIYANA